MWGTLPDQNPGTLALFQYNAPHLTSANHIRKKRNAMVHIRKLISTCALSISAFVFVIRFALFWTFTVFVDKRKLYIYQQSLDFCLSYFWQIYISIIFGAHSVNFQINTTEYYIMIKINWRLWTELKSNWVSFITQMWNYYF